MSESATAEVRREPAPARREPDERVGRSDLVHGSAGPSRRRRRKLLRYLLFALGIVVLVGGALWYWVNGGRYVVTSDAYVQANVLLISTDVSGIVDHIPVREGEQVKQGQVLFRLDPMKFQIALDNAQANLAQTVLSLNSLKADYQKAEAQVAGQEAVIAADQATYDRYAALVRQRAITPQQLDDARAKLASDKAALNSITANVKSELARLGGHPDTPVEQMPAYKQAAAQVAEAEREFNHAIVRAPFDGVVTQVSKLQPGQFLPSGTAAFGLVDSNDMWIAAQPKETYLTYARAGQSAKVTVDAYPGHTWTGTVESIAPATDQEFSVLPAQNSSGNWVKVVQRVPVRIDLHQTANDPPLSAGMSAEVSIDTHHKRTIGDLF